MKVTLYLAVTTAIPIPSTQPARRVEILEDGSVIAQGLVITRAGVTETTLPGVPFVIEDRVATGAGMGRILGHPTQVYRAADIYCTVASKGAATTVVVREFD